MTLSLERANAKDDTKMGSERSFGLIFSAVFALISLIPLVHGAPFRLWALVISIAFLLPALVMPTLLSPLNRLWFRFGLLLHRIVNPLVLGFIFFAIIAPLGLVTRWAGGKLLTLGYDDEKPSYWERRNPPGPDAQSLRNQF